VNEITLRPQNMGELMEFAKMAANTDMVPKDFKGKPEAIVIACMMGHELGLPPLAALQNIAVINGRPSVWGDALLAIVQASGELDDINEVYDTETSTAHCHVVRKGRTPQTRSFSLQDAKNAGLLGKQGPWKQYPQRMQQLRARAFALRDVFADQLRGIRVVEEEKDREATEVDVTPGRTAPAALASTQVAKTKAALESRPTVVQKNVPEKEVGETRQQDASDAYDALFEKIRTSNTLDDLTGLAADLGQAELAAPDMNKLRKAWKARRTELTAVKEDHSEFIEEMGDADQTA
jgi:hypothetical protein